MQCSGFSQGQYIRWWTAAEPKSQRNSSPVRVYSEYRQSLSRVHSPMDTPVRYRMLLLSNTSRAPRPLASIAPMARRSRYSRSREKSTRSSKSTFIRPGAGAVGRDGVAMGSPDVEGLQSLALRFSRRHCVQHDSTYVQCGCQEPHHDMSGHVRWPGERLRWPDRSTRVWNSDHGFAVSGRIGACPRASWPAASAARRACSRWWVGVWLGG